ncbi:AAA family ATPase [Sulfidibacter corallicola]|uniref:AAA family ATPase n=1 Tax=Sulfidibacter corallicola TaxID=2818388 RepID=A0A8A4TWJ9_SULCO|nr:MoxR family ATPase [Sulfidibacter corallicola]QTD53727.1 AAA family ATPase [Sulfidibacter corallicola]
MSAPTAANQLVPPEVLEVAKSYTDHTLEQLDKILLGRSQLHRLVLIAVLARGHLLLEGMPGLGKTELVKALGAILDLDFKRVQFTPDLMPSDILGAHILQETATGGREMSFRPGPVFTNILLADEINRASPKTQSALLEAMQEGAVTLLGETRPLPSPFFVLASQNPIDLEGTYPLPEAQLDRFLFKLEVGTPEVDVLAQIIGTRRRGLAPKPDWRLSREELAKLFGVLEHIFVPKPVCQFISRLVAASHPEHPLAPALVKENVSFGASPRAAIAIAEAVRALALIEGRPTAGFEDVRVVAESALNHRLILKYQAKVNGVTSRDLIQALLAEITQDDLTLPKGVSLEDRRA